MTPLALRHLARVEPRLKPLIKAVGPCPLKPRRGCSPYEALVRSVTFQQLNGKAAETILGRVRALYPERHFPEPAELLATPDDALRGAGLSRAKTLAVKDIAAKTLAGLVPDRRAASRLSDAELLERLTQVRGVGPWTVQMFLIFTLARPDVMPATDYGVQQGFARLYGLPAVPKPADLIIRTGNWAPYRSTGAWYLWRVLEFKTWPPSKPE